MNYKVVEGALLAQYWDGWPSPGC